MRVVIAMSGGVDSSVAAALLVEQGHEVIGVSMRTHRLPPQSNRACCTPDDMRDARRTASRLGIPFYLLAYEDLFEREVIAPFVAAYERGETPNPCVVCNDKVKFAPLLAQARLLGADKLATGHYARIETTAKGATPALHRAVDQDKDQSYFLYRLRPDQLASLVFPLGQMRKSEVRQHARRLGLGEAVADKKESQEICFVGPKGYAAVVEARRQTPAPKKNNVFVSLSGQVLGTHAGVHHFTLGQRRGLGVAAAQPLYVTDIDADSGQVTLGDKADLLVHQMILRHATCSGEVPDGTEVLGAQLRHRGQPVPVTAVWQSGQWLLHPQTPCERPAPGQAVVLYRAHPRGAQVVGGGIAKAAPRPARLPLWEAAQSA